MVWPAVIAAGATIAGGLMANRANKQIAQSQEAAQREFAQYGIRWKTEDAKAAGLHPLYALGANTASYSPVTYSDSLGPALAEAGQTVARGYEVETDRKSRERMAQRQVLLEQDKILLEQQKFKSSMMVDAAMANYYNSVAAKARQDANAHNDLPLSGAGKPRDESVPPVGGLTQEVPSKIVSANKQHPEFQAGPAAPAWQLKNLGPFKIVVPESDEGWGEDLGLTKLAVIALATSAYYSGIAVDKIGPYIRKNYKRIMDSQAYKDVYRRITRAEADRSSNLKGGFQGTGEF